MLLFDGDCGFCTVCVGFIERRIRPAAEVLPYQWQDLAGYGVTAERAAHEVLWVRPDGTVSGGARGVAALLRSARGPWRPLGYVLAVPPVSWAAHGLYRLVARNRHKLPGGTAACSIAAAPPRR
ncbi:putative DCC family thiol-disulfide oxidoreductase YuxK [Actinocorallia herbida]|uniref:Putative DCC family thiol-disulfide oxidoreductase YuxK n=1 Tax=Actinocorallia herbida TaxID=58109 RepID=A0A3N1CSS1_9ACTN|nr:putative DCC family thiol-disulfide oxidoreductase YuxK [Actinocorallia herbida]